MRSFRTSAVLLLTGLLSGSSASAHYLWVLVDAKDGEHGKAHIYFEEGPAAGDGGYLDPFVKAGVTWIRTAAQPQPHKLDVQEQKTPGKRWLAASLDRQGPRSIDSYGKFGVYRYGTTDVLLHYYARQLEVSTHDDLHELGRAEQMALDIVPHDTAEGLELTVLWQGKPAAQRPIYVRGPKAFKTTLTTGDDGRATLKLPADAAGRCLLRTFVEQEQGGQDDGKDYVKIRHNATLVLTLPLEG